MTVQEPNEIDESTVTEHGIENFAAIVYEKSQTSPGIKQLALAGMKDVLGYNSHKADNIAALCGFPKGGGNNNHRYDYTGDIEVVGNTVLEKIDYLAANTGVPAGDAPGTTPLADRATALENNVGTLEDHPTSTLMERMSTAETDIGNIKMEIGNYSPSGQTMTDKIQSLENKVDGTAGNPGLEELVKASGTGLVDRTTALETTVGDTSSGLVKDVADNASAISALQSAVGDSSSGLTEKVYALDCAYKFQGDVNAANVQSVIDAANLVDGMVWHCTEPVEFWYPAEGTEHERKWTYETDVNFAYDAPDTSSGQGTFHPLGINFNTNEFKDVVGRFKSEVNPESSWNCVDNIGKAGTYLISGMSGNNTTNFKSFAFIAHLNGNGYLEGDPIDLGGFSDTFTNNSAVIALKSGVTFKTEYGINITRLGV